ncbi:TPA: hypothetical protein ACH3X2_008416 [Trebouxia sp. C0005]
MSGDAIVLALGGRGPPESTGIAAALWLDSAAHVASALHSPFVRSLADGSLPKQTFQHYVAQDAFFLKAFAQAYALALGQTQVPEERSTLQVLLNGVDAELDLHKGYAKSWGVRLGQMQVPTATTKSYIDMLLDVALHQSLPCILAAMVPCTRLYAYIGCQLRAAAMAAPNTIRARGPYGSWIKEYSSDAFLGLPASKEALLDKLGSSVPYGTLRKLYRTAMQMEVDFFSAQPGTGPPPAIRMLVVDFDDTCTATDTTSQVFNTATTATVESSADSEKADVQNRLETLKDKLVQNYVQEQQKLYAELLPEGATHPDAIDQQKATAFVDALTQFDRRMNQVVIDSGILKGIPQGRLKAAGEQIGLQAGCLTVLTRAQQAGIPTHVVSVNYSSQMVKAALQRGSLNIVAADGVSAEEHHDAVIHANELTYEQGLSTGGIIRRIQGGSDKDALMSELMHNSIQANSTDGADADAEASKLAVYIGDSPSDFAPLLRADLGIVVGQNRLLRQVAKAHGVKVLPLTAAPANGRGEEGSLYEAESWAAIGAFLFGPDPSKALTPHPGSGQGSKSGIKVPRVMTVAGSDSGGGAGIQADLKTYQARGIFGTSAISALTAQNTRGVRGVHTVPTQHLSDQMEAVLSDIGADVVKTGMLPTPEAVVAVADAVRAHKMSTLVVDPVLVATSGDSLAGFEVAQALKTHLFPLATIITPNLPEASALLGNRRVSDLATMKQAAQDLHKLGPKYVLIKGGHLMAAPSDPNRPSSDSQPSSSSTPTQTPSASSAAQDSESAAASSAAQDSDSAAARSAAQDSQSAAAQDGNTGQEAMHDSDQPVSELSADSSLGEGHWQRQVPSQKTETDRAEQDTAQHSGEMGQVQPVSPLMLLYVHFAQLGSLHGGCCKARQANLIEHTQRRRLSCPQLLAVQACLGVYVCAYAVHACNPICIHTCFHCMSKVIVVFDCNYKTMILRS